VQPAGHVYRARPHRTGGLSKARLLLVSVLGVGGAGQVSCAGVSQWVSRNRWGLQSHPLVPWRRAINRVRSLFSRSMQGLFAVRPDSPAAVAAVMAAGSASLELH
jgi:hypothetical protein